MEPDPAKKTCLETPQVESIRLPSLKTLASLVVGDHLLDKDAAYTWQLMTGLPDEIKEFTFHSMITHARSTNPVQKALWLNSLAKRALTSLHDKSIIGSVVAPYLDYHSNSSAGIKQAKYLAEVFGDTQIGKSLTVKNLQCILKSTIDTRLEPAQKRILLLEKLKKMGTRFVQETPLLGPLNYALVQRHGQTELFDYLVDEKFHLHIARSAGPQKNLTNINETCSLLERTRNVYTKVFSKIDSLSGLFHEVGGPATKKIIVVSKELLRAKQLKDNEYSLFVVRPFERCLALHNSLKPEDIFCTNNKCTDGPSIIETPCASQ